MGRAARTMGCMAMAPMTMEPRMQPKAVPATSAMTIWWRIRLSEVTNGDYSTRKPK